MHVLSSSRRRAGTGAALVVVAALLWGTVGLAGAIIRERSGVPVLTIGFWRLAIGAAATLPLLRRHTVARGDRRRLALIGAGLAGYQACFFGAVALAGVSLATLVTLGLAPVLIGAGSRMLLREAPQRTTVVALVAALTGLGLVVGAPVASAAGTTAAGALLAAGSATGYAAVTLLTRQRDQRGDATGFAAAALGAGAVAALPAAAWHGVAVPGDTVTVLLLLYLGVGPTALGYIAFIRGLTTVAPTTAAVLTLLEPAVATLLAVVLLGEHLGAAGATGALLLVGTAGVVTVLQSRRPVTPVEEATT